MKILGIDYGEKRIGLAISDEGLMLARELSILSPKEFWDTIESLLATEEIATIVLGWPLGLSGNETKKTEEVNNFKLKLEQKLKIPVVLVDERLSSVMAGNLSGSHKNIDSLAAQIILQNYLNQQKAST
jgi:putative Holliday junction resolvase